MNTDRNLIFNILAEAFLEAEFHYLPVANELFIQFLFNEHFQRSFIVAYFIMYKKLS